MVVFKQDTKKTRHVCLSHSEAGVVLIFSLIMLLILTLLSINMIQQNKLEFMMAGNAQSQTVAFSSAENILRLTENYIDNTLHIKYSQKCIEPIYTPDGTQVNYTCYNEATRSYNIPNQVIDLVVGDIKRESIYHCDATSPSDELNELASIANVDSITNAWEITDQLFLNNTDAKVSIVSIACISHTPITENVCKDSSSASLLLLNKCTSVNNCATILYTLNIVTKTNMEAERIVESKYGVRCDDENRQN